MELLMLDKSVAK